MHFSVDRIVGARAVLMGEDGKPLETPSKMLPSGAKEGDMLLYSGGKFLLDTEKTAERRKQVSDMLAKLLRRADETDGG